MIDEINTAIDAYKIKWGFLVDKRTDKAFFVSLKPTAIGWKTEDRAEYDKIYQELHDQSDQIIETWMNGRWVAKFHLRDAALHQDIEIIKLMQRRPGSTDAIGLDHLDFYSPDVAMCERILGAEPDLTWSRESNDIIAGYDWLSIWFENTEAKLKHDTVLDIIQAELHTLNKHIMGSSSS